MTTIQNDLIPNTENELEVVVGGATMVEYALIVALRRSPRENRAAIAVEKMHLLPDMET